MLPALFREARVNRTDIFVQQAIEAARPRLLDPVPPQPRGQSGGIVIRQAAERPAREMDVDVDHTRMPFAVMMGVSSRRRLPPSMAARAVAEMFAP